MGHELKIQLPYDTPVVGFEISPRVTYADDWRIEVPKEELSFKWHRMQRMLNVFCHVHPFARASFQCVTCVNLNVRVCCSYFCSPNCFSKEWPSHCASHHVQQTGPANVTSDPDYIFDDVGSSCGATRELNKSPLVEEEEHCWILVCTSETYIPQIEDVGCVLFLECVAVDSKTGMPKGPPCTTYTSYVIEAPKSDSRHLVEIHCLSGNEDFTSEGRSGTKTFSVLSYNILSAIYATNDVHLHCSPWILSWEYRRLNLLREIVGYKADILCLQEVQSNHFENFFAPELAKHGYSVVYKPRAYSLYTRDGHVSDGCATFFRSDRFKEINRYELEFDKVVVDFAESLGLQLDAQSRVRLSKPNVAVIVLLELTENKPVSGTSQSRSSQYFCVANTHIHANHEFAEVKLLQVRTLLDKLENIIGKERIPLLLCGDLNSLPGSAVHDLIVVGSVDPNHVDLGVDPTRVIQKVRLSNSIPLVSAYSSIFRAALVDQDAKQLLCAMDWKTREPHFRHFKHDFAGTLDYIFYTEDKLRVQSLLQLLTAESLGGYIPSPQFSSDHMALMAKFCVKGQAPKSPRAASETFEEKEPVHEQ